MRGGALAVLLLLPLCQTFSPAQVAWCCRGSFGGQGAWCRIPAGAGGSLQERRGGLGGAPGRRRHSRPRRGGSLSLRSGGEDAACDEWEVLMGALKSKGASLRPAEEGELGRILQLSERFREEMNPETFASMLQSGGMEWMRSEISEVLQVNDMRPPHLLVLCEGGAISGYIYSTVEEWFGAESLYIAELFVEERHRGRGLGGLLTAVSLHLATVNGITCSHLCVGERQQVAGRMYTESFGFAPLEGMEGLMTDLELKNVKMGVKAYCGRLVAKDGG